MVGIVAAGTSSGLGDGVRVTSDAVSATEIIGTLWRSATDGPSCSAAAARYESLSVPILEDIDDWSEERCSADVEVRSDLQVGQGQAC